ncbi:hypothetical protein EAS56_37890 [Bradyrhizobium guangzhouense]|uniref:Uncharacterized protein n=1 Tax=Bradyrhizobium guangzhouense TaxID=1325095 RepID=A0ABY0DWS6_9BRAD|nr:hypothetical protein EAS56_37890 [Bradyrhizobium guangzhouense]
MNRPPILGAQDSATLRERLLAQLTDTDDLLAWAKTSLPLKNTLQESDARSVEAAYEKGVELAAANAVEGQSAPDSAQASASDAQSQPTASQAGETQPVQGTVERGLAFPKELPRKRSNAHLAFVRERPCLVVSPLMV